MTSSRLTGINTGSIGGSQERTARDVDLFAVASGVPHAYSIFADECFEHGSFHSRHFPGEWVTTRHDCLYIVTGDEPEGDRSSRRFRARARVDKVTARPGGQFLTKITVTIEIENETRPALVAEILSLYFMGDES